jgi:hypothetical protein
MHFRHAAEERYRSSVHGFRRVMLAANAVEELASAKAADGLFVFVLEADRASDAVRTC